MKILIVIIFIICTSLGTWQVYRMNYKDILINRINTTEYIKLNDLLEKNKEKKENLEYTKIITKGKYIKNKNIFLYQDNNHYKVLTPFIDENNAIFLINRGIIEEKNKDKLNNLILDNSAQTIKGLIKFNNKTMPFINNDIINNIWLYIDISTMADYLELDLSNFIVIAEDQDKNNIIKQNENIIINNYHSHYIIMWYTLSFIMIMYLHRQFNRK